MRKCDFDNYFVRSGINQLILDKFWDNVSEINLDDKNKKY